MSVVGVAGAEWSPSPNFGTRRPEQDPTLVVVHYTAMASAEAARAWMCAAEAQVSAHYLIARNGDLWQLVDERDRAWHAGAGRWHTLEDVNSASIGIEIDNPGDAPFSEPAMASLERVLRDLLSRWPISPVGVIGHSDLAPGRKIDPGPRFDWCRLARQGLSVWPDGAGGAAEAEEEKAADFDVLLRQAGYTADTPAEVRLAAFRSRFRPGVSGAPDARDRRLLAALHRHCDQPAG